MIWLAGQPEALAAFLGASGLSTAACAAARPTRSSSASCSISSSAADAIVLDFARSAGLRPEDPARARAALAGGDLPHWT